MKYLINKIMIIIYITLFFIMINMVTVNAATFSISSSSSVVEPGGSFNVSITSNGAGYVNLTCVNGTLSESYVWVEGTKTRTCKAAGTEGTIKISASGTIADFATGEDESKSGSTSVTIKKKEEPKPAETQTTPQTTTNNSQGTTTNNNQKTTTNTNKNTTNTNKKTTTTKKQESTIIVNEEDQGTTEELGIEAMNLFAVKTNGEKNEIELTPVFESGVYEYTLNVESDVEKIEIDSKYNDKYELKIEGLEENLKVGENIVNVSIKRGEETKKYTIKVIKEEPKEVLETEEVKEIKEEKKEENKISLSIIELIVYIVLAIAIENVIIFLVYIIIKEKKKTNSFRKGKR